MSVKAWRRYEWKGWMLTLRELSEKSGIPEPTLRKRLVIMNWTVQRAMTEPVRPFTKEPRT